jgi:two-component system sensor histidine kinase RpfC
MTHGNLNDTTPRLLRRLSAWKAGIVANADRPELEQSLLRVAIGGAVMLYLFWYALRDGVIERAELAVLCVSVAFFVFGVIVTAVIVVHKGTSVVRRYVAMVADNAVTTYCLYQMGEGGAVVIGVYLFITFGNGFRYGRRYLYVCQALGIAGFGCVLAFSEFWSQHIAIGIGFLIGLVVLPVYVGVLAERIRVAMQRADEASRAKGRFVANVSHEMRTPLNGVIAMADVLRETDLNDSQREIVETMTTSAQVLLAQIEDVLDLSKIEAGRLKADLRPFELGRLLSSTVKVIVPQARYKGLLVRTDIAENAAGWFVGDPLHLRQVLLNLLSNAVKFTEKGEVCVRASASEGSAPDTAKVRIEVQDTGIGIPAEKQEAVFEPFTQADDSITRVYGGTGLGTTIARQLVQLMGGRIGVVSTVDLGSLFWIEIELPRAQPQGLDLASTFAPPVGAAPPAALANVHKLRGARILVAEDNATNRRVTQLILESRGHIVTIVDNGEKALDALERGGFALALFDLSMPVVSGLEALKLYRFSTPNPIPVLIVSAHVTTEVMVECQRAGAAEFVAKPVRASSLLDAVDRQLAAATEDASAPPPFDERPVLAVVPVPALDPTVVEELAKLSADPTFLERLMRGFESDTRRLVDELTTALSQRRYDAVQDVAHALKGGAASVGASQLTQLALRIERSTNESLRLRASQLVQELTQASNSALAAVDELIERRSQKRKAP